MTANPCDRCGAPPLLPVIPGRLFLWAPLAHTEAKLSKLADTLGLSPERRPDCLVVPADGADNPGLLGRLGAGLTSRERRAVRSLFMAGDAEPGFADFPRVSSLDALEALSQADWLLEVLDRQRLTSYFQPIRGLRDDAPFGHEALLRVMLPGGDVQPPGRLFSVARESDLLFRLDQAARLTAVERFAATGAGGMLFINFTPNAVYDPAACLRSTFARVRALGLDPGRIVFEVVESEQVADSGHLLGVLQHYRDAGFRVALDDIGSGYSSLNLLHELRPDFVKLDMRLLQGVAEDRYKAVLAGKLIEAAREMGLTTVCEGIETEADLGWVRAAGADLVQGYLIGRPAAQPQKT